MISQLRPRSSGGVAFLQLCLELGSLVSAVVLATRLESSLPSLSAVTLGVVFALLMVCLNAAFGLYRRNRRLNFSEYVVRQSAALSIGLPAAYVLSRLLPGGTVFQQAFVPLVVIALGGLLAVRQIMVSPVARALLPYRVLVLGTGPEALAVETSLEVANPPGLALAGFYPLEQVPARSIAASRIVSSHRTLEETVKHLGIDEIIVAVQEQRGGVLPLRALLDCRLSGIQITDLARFFERVDGRVPIDLLKASWLIYGKGFRQTWVRSFVKRGFDIIVTAVLLPIALPIIGAMAFLISLDGGTPIIYRQERVGYRGQKFTLLKFRSMTQDAEKDGQAFWASINDKRITAVGRFMRRTRIDELPQLINVLRGEMSFVGPSPERPHFVALLTEKIPFYGVRHSVKPGLTGWAQVRYTYGGKLEESVKKLEYDLYYVKNHSLLLDILILLRAARNLLTGRQLMMSPFARLQLQSSLPAQINRANAKARSEFIYECGGILTSADVAELVDSATRNRASIADRWKKEGKIFAVTHKQREYFPALQFDLVTRKPRPEIHEVLKILGSDYEGWQIALWFSTRNPWLGGKTPLEVLKSEPHKVIDAARSELAMLNDG